MSDICYICPRNCKTNRETSASGYCRSDSKYYIASVFIHKGEEPPISGNKGICNVFFAHCNLQCVYCQNYQISKNTVPLENFLMSEDVLLKKITNILDQGIESVGFVSPSHFVPQVIQIVKKLRDKNYFPTIVYNTNGYDSIKSLQELESFVDIYLPDLKYVFSDIAKKYSKTADYPQVALAALKEMYRQKGSHLYINSKGYAESGMIIRHLILPNNVENSVEVLKFIAHELSSDIHISLMSQYYPTADAFDYPEISRMLNISEYEIVKKEAEKLGLINGWFQEMESNEHYKPNFENYVPFED